jgi:SAM-dependent methyltransferase
MQSFFLRIRERLRRRAEKRFLKPIFNDFQEKMPKNSTFINFPKSIGRNLSADPTEFFSHYDAFSFWTYSKIRQKLNKSRILDLGSTKLMNAVMSFDHEVTAIVLANPRDTLSKVNYLEADAGEKLPFPNSYFGIATSTVSLHLIGLGRYGDLVNPNAISNFISELHRVTKDNAYLYISVPIGIDELIFNGGYSFSFDTFLELFHQWELIDFLIDYQSTPNAKLTNLRFSKVVLQKTQNSRDYNVTFFEFRKK